MMSPSTLDGALNETQALESFLFEFLEKLPTDLASGEDVAKYASKFGLTLPESLNGEAIAWDPTDESYKVGGTHPKTIVLVRPGHGNPSVLGLVIKCVTIRGWRVCLECGWLYCRIVISKRF